MAAHAILGASSSKRWMTCTPSARFEMTIPIKDTSSKFSEEGTLAHELLEVILSNRLGKTDLEAYAKQIAECRASIEQKGFDYQEIEANVMTVATFVMNYVGPKAKVMLEQRLDYSKWVQAGFGTGDILIIDGDTLFVMDLKYGRGVRVDAENNSQMRLYALGAINTFPEDVKKVKKVIMTILQPRLDNYGTEEMDIKDLLKWAENEVVPKAKLAWEGAGEFTPDKEGCRFCKAKDVCRARARDSVTQAQRDFLEPNLLSADELGQLILRAEKLSSWLNTAKEYATKQAIESGMNVPGFALREGRTNRRYRTDVDVLESLRERGFRNEEVTETTLLSVSALEKKVGKGYFADNLMDLTVKPPGELKLVKVGDDPVWADDF